MEAPAVQTRKVSSHLLSRVLTPGPGPSVSPLPAAPPGVRLAVLSPWHSERWLHCPPSPNPFLLLSKAGSAPPAGNPAPPPSLPPDRELGTVPAAQSDCQSAPWVPPPILTWLRPRQPVGIRATGQISACAQVKPLRGAKRRERGRVDEASCLCVLAGDPERAGLWSRPENEVGMGEGDYRMSWQLNPRTH